MNFIKICGKASFSLILNSFKLKDKTVISLTIHLKNWYRQLNQNWYSLKYWNLPLFCGFTFVTSYLTFQHY